MAVPTHWEPISRSVCLATFACTDVGAIIVAPYPISVQTIPDGASLPCDQYVLSLWKNSAAFSSREYEDPLTVQAKIIDDTMTIFMRSS